MLYTYTYSSMTPLGCGTKVDFWTCWDSVETQDIFGDDIVAWVATIGLGCFTGDRDSELASTWIKGE